MNAQMSEQIARGAEVFPSGRTPGGPARPPEPPRPDGYPPFNPTDLASPVGPQYGEQVDWAAAAAMPAKAVPPWKLALLFLGAIGAALLVTLLVAVIAR
jgi:hypothetical protein